MDINHEDLLEDIPFPQAPANSNYVPDAVVAPGEPWLYGGPSRAVLSLPSCLCLCENSGSGASGPGCSGEDRVELKVYAKCQLQQGVMFGPFLGEVCRGQMPNNLKYAWAVSTSKSALFWVCFAERAVLVSLRHIRIEESEAKQKYLLFTFIFRCFSSHSVEKEVYQLVFFINVP